VTRAIDLSDLPAPFVEAIESLVNAYREKNSPVATPAAAGRPIGWLKGRWEIPESFFEPLPDDVLDLFEAGVTRQ
jgi:hypothetical protein